MINVENKKQLYLLWMCCDCSSVNEERNDTVGRRCFSVEIPPPSRNCAHTFFERSFLYGAPYDERVRRLTDFNMFKSEIKTLLFLRYFDH